MQRAKRKKWNSCIKAAKSFNLFESIHLLNRWDAITMRLDNVLVALLSSIVLQAFYLRQWRIEFIGGFRWLLLNEWMIMCKRMRSFCHETLKCSVFNSTHIAFRLISFPFIFLIPDENNSLSQTIPDKPIELRHFTKLCEQRRKFRVLYKLEFQVSQVRTWV